MATARTRQQKPTKKKWLKRSLLVFFVIFLAIYGLVFTTGDKSATPKLGIDLQGGTRVTLAPQGERPTADQLQQARRILESRVNGMGVSGAEVVTDGDNLVITVPGEDASEARALGQTSQLLFRPNSQPQPTTPKFAEVYKDMANRWVEAGIVEKKATQEKMNDLLKAMKEQNAPGLPDKLTVTAKEPAEPKNSVEEQKRRDKQVQILLKDRQSEDPDTQSAAAGLLDCSGPDPLSGADDPAKPLVTCSPQGPMVLGPAPVLIGDENKDKPRRLTGDMIDTNSTITGGFDAQSAQMAITFRFKTGKDTPGGETWYKLGQDMMNQQVAITLDSQVISAPQIQGATPPGEVSQITGQFTEKEAQDLANNLRYGALPLSFVGENGEPGGTATTISPTMGEASLRAGLIAGLVGLVLASLYALWYYRGLGLIAIVSLVASVATVFGLLVLLGRWIGYSLDLAGIAGLIIGIGTTADSFVVYFERIKDEILGGSTFRSAVPRAWDRARGTIVTGNFVSLIAAVILYFLAIGDVKGFAFTLGLTTVVDVLVAFLLTAPLTIMLSRKPFSANRKVNGLGPAFRLAESRGYSPTRPQFAAATADVKTTSGSTESSSTEEETR